tara:strand:- start:43 stop:621 length:579 start_codon:yes stop_codon:yes gene_type:complete
MSKYSNFDLRNFIAEGKKSKEDNMEEAAPGFEHDCAAHVVHETYGYGVCIEGKHTLVENAEGKHEVTHYDVFFKSGDTIESIPVNELKVLTSESHTHGKRKRNEGEVDEENVQEGLKDMLIRAIDKLFGLDKFNQCIEAGWDSSEECKKMKMDMGYSKVKSGFEKSAGAKIYESKLTKEEAFKKEIKDLLDS